MGNTIQSAKDFLTKYRDERTHPVSVDYFAEMMVAYSNSVRPDVVVPSEKEVKSDLIYHSYRAGLVAVWGFIALLFNPCTKAD